MSKSGGVTWLKILNRFLGLFVPSSIWKLRHLKILTKNYNPLEKELYFLWVGVWLLATWLFGWMLLPLCRTIAMPLRSLSCQNMVVSSNNLFPISSYLLVNYAFVIITLQRCRHIKVITRTKNSFC